MIVRASKLSVTSGMFIAQAGVITLLLSSPLCISASPDQASTATYSHPKHSIATRQETVGISNFAEVTPTLYRGGQPSLTGIETLQKRGIDIVVDMRGGRTRSEKAAVKHLGLQYVSIPWHCPFPSDKPFAKFLKLIQENPGKKVFVHCRLGDDRTGMAVAAFRMAEQGWNADEAMYEMSEFGFTPAHHEICPRLAHYERTFPQRFKTSPAFRDVRTMANFAPSK